MLKERKEDLVEFYDTAECDCLVAFYWKSWRTLNWLKRLQEVLKYFFTVKHQKKEDLVLITHGLQPHDGQEH